MNPLAQASSENEGTRMALPGFPDDDEIEQLWRIGLFSPDDARALRKLWRILRGQTDDYLDIVLGMVAAHPVLDEVLSVLGGESPEEIFDGSTSLRRQFRQWLFETCQFPHDPPWIKQLYSKRMQDFPEQSLASTRLPRFRYILALAFPLAATAHSFLAAAGGNQQDIERMQYALLKAILLQMDLLSMLYVKEGFW
ncbi:MAG TPA: hypothetical protein DEP36_16615 [Gammaproteobacteria bacterium]|nr:hypothetical protein [Gammaproteobacteria bacterium]HRF45324.1 protoglobin domain-containing protein [Candidatus Competibacteraceae bacterium]